MSIMKLKTIGKRALPPTNTNTARQPLAGRVIVGMLTGDEDPEHVTTNSEVITSAKDRRR